jgi:hypothetical protein
LCTRDYRQYSRAAIDKGGGCRGAIQAAVKLKRSLGELEYQDAYS